MLRFWCWSSHDCMMWSMFADSMETAIWWRCCWFSLVRRKLCLFFIKSSQLKVVSQRYVEANMLRINLAHVVKFGNCFSLISIQTGWKSALRFFTFLQTKFSVKPVSCCKSISSSFKILATHPRTPISATFAVAIGRGFPKRRNSSLAFLES